MAGKPSPGLRAYDKPKEKPAPVVERAPAPRPRPTVQYPLCPGTTDGRACTIRVREGLCSPHRALAEAAGHAYEADLDHKAEPQWRRCAHCGHRPVDHADKGSYRPKEYTPPRPREDWRGRR